MRVEQLLERSAQRFPGKTAIVVGGDRWSYQQVEQRCNRVAHALVDAGLQRGDRVAICLDNNIEAVISVFGVLKAGGVFFLVNPGVSGERLTSLLADSGAMALIARAEPVAAVQTTWPRLTRLRTVLVVGRGSVPVPSGVRSMSFQKALDDQAVATTPPVKRHFDADLAALVYTSGSTGAPKGVMLTHANLTFAAAAICTYLENTPDDVILNVLPLAFTYGLGQVTTAFHAGATLVLERSCAYPRVLLDTMAREQVTGFALVPTIATLLLRQDLTSRRFPRLRYLTNAAAALSAIKIQRLREAFPYAGIYSMYGQTECQRVSYLPPDQIDTRPASVGIAIPGTEAYVVDEHGERALPGTIGELVVCGPHVMRGYWNQPNATARALRPGARPGETLLYTGDLFQVDHDGFLYFVDRMDDIIKTGGEKVAPCRVEEVVAQLPGVAEVAAYGLPDELLGEVIGVVITLTSGARVSGEDVQRHCREHLGAFMVPKIVDVAKALPTTMSGKVSRRALQAMTMSAAGAARL
jgi:amino acid adenylation domain-containing protein